MQKFQFVVPGGSRARRAVCRAGVVALMMSPTLAACGSTSQDGGQGTVRVVPAETGGEAAAPTAAGKDAVAVSRDDLVAILAEYDKRNNAAIALANPPKRDYTGFKAADIGVALAIDEYGQVVGDPDESYGPAQTTLIDTMGAFSTNGQGSALLSTTFGSQSASEPSAMLSYLYQPKPGGPWMLGALAALRTNLATPLAGTQAIPTAQDLAEADAVAQDFTKYLSGADLTLIAPDSKLDSTARATLPAGTTLVSRQGEQSPRSSSGQSTTIDGSVHAVKVTGGTLALCTFVQRLTVRVSDGTEVPAASAFAVAFMIVPGGKATVVAGSSGPIQPST